MDNIAIKLGETEAKPLRLGHFTRIMNDAKKYSIDNYIQTDDCYAVLQDIKRSIEKTIKKVKRERESLLRLYEQQGLVSRMNKVSPAN